jgi:hypothetical protein
MGRAVRIICVRLLMAALTLALGWAQEDARSSLMTPEENTVLDRVREYATSYTASLPNFVCIQDTRRLIAEAKGKPWKPIDEVGQKLNFVSGHESYELVSAARPRKSVHTPLSVVSRGEFGTLMRLVLVKNSANFGWLGWDEIQGQKVAVFTYRVPLNRTSMRIESGQSRAMVGFHGLIFALPETGAVYRITTEAEDIPHDMPFQRMGSDTEYGPVVIGGESYLLPVKTFLSSAAGPTVFRNESAFRDYKKFGADSTIVFPKEAN